MKCTWCEDSFEHEPLWGPGKKDDRKPFCDEDCRALWVRKTAIKPGSIANVEFRDPFVGPDGRPEHQARRIDEIKGQE